LAVLVLAICVRVALGPISNLNQAQAQIPDSGLQRKQLLDEAKRTNQLLTEIKQLLTSHTFNVRVQGADNQERGGAPPTAPGRNGR
jgi:hypothetical protein